MDDGEVLIEVQDYKYNCLQCTFYPRAVASNFTDFVLLWFLSGTLQVYSWFQNWAQQHKDLHSPNYIL